MTSLSAFFSSMSAPNTASSRSPACGGNLPSPLTKLFNRVRRSAKEPRPEAPAELEVCSFWFVIIIYNNYFISINLIKQYHIVVYHRPLPKNSVTKLGKFTAHFPTSSEQPFHTPIFFMCFRLTQV